jgi:uncharacterized protein (DUF952 family)
MPIKHQIVYKICDQKLWSDTEQAGVFIGAEIDLADGFIHFSTFDQVASTLALHFAGRKNLLLIAVDAAAMGEQIVYEAARGGTLFPHLYRSLSLEFVLSAKPIIIGDNGEHIIPEIDH